jgi:nitroreductase
MQTWDAIRARRNVRVYTDDAVSEDDLRRIAEAGWRAPSASNRQHWDFVVVTDRERLKELSAVWRGAGHIAGAAAAIALVLPEPPDERTRLTDRYDLGQATYAMMLAAADLGVGTGHSSVGEQAKARALLGVPDSTRWLTCWASATRPTVRCARSSSRTGARSKRSSTASSGEAHSSPVARSLSLSNAPDQYAS